MIAYQFRFLDVEGKPSGWCGFAFAEDYDDLFWQIDSHGDPYMAEIKRMSSGSVCIQYKQTRGVAEEIPETAEIHSIDGMFDTEEWERPKWDNIHE